MNRDLVEFITFSLMTGTIIFLMFDNRKLERLNTIAVRAAVKEQAKRKTLEVILYGKELDNNNVFEDDSLY